MSDVVAHLVAVEQDFAGMVVCPSMRTVMVVPLVSIPREIGQPFILKMLLILVICDLVSAISFSPHKDSASRKQCQIYLCIVETLPIFDQRSMERRIRLHCLVLSVNVT